MTDILKNTIKLPSGKEIEDPRNYYGSWVDWALQQSGGEDGWIAYFSANPEEPRPSVEFLAKDGKKIAFICWWTRTPSFEIHEGLKSFRIPVSSKNEFERFLKLRAFE